MFFIVKCEARTLCGKIKTCQGLASSHAMSSPALSHPCSRGPLFYKTPTQCGNQEFLFHLLLSVEEVPLAFTFLLDFFFNSEFLTKEVRFETDQQGLEGVKRHPSCPRGTYRTLACP